MDAVLLQHDLCQGRVPVSLTAQRFLSDKLQAFPLAYRHNMFLNGTGRVTLISDNSPPPPLPAGLSLILSCSPCLFCVCVCDVIFSLSSHSLQYPEALWDERLIVFVLALFSKSALLNVDVE